jgi:tRNA threonylcarbamoyl adenosine modification protein YeaZ
LTGYWLGIDTTSNPGGVALVSSSKLLAETVLPVTAQHSETILPAVGSVLGSSGVKGEELAGIGVSLGPGSYTGIRIGIATAIGLSAGWKVPLKGVSALRVAASFLPDGPAAVCVRARAGEVFAGVFSSPHPLSKVLVPQALYTASSFEGVLDSSMYNASGSGRTEVSSSSLKWSNPLFDRPLPSMVAWCASILLLEHGADAGIEPLYLRRFNEKAGSP